jgi:hypothetical protein
MSQNCCILVPEDRDAVFIHGVPVHLPGMLVSLLGILKSPLGQFLSGLMVLFLTGFRCAAMSVGGDIVQFGGPLMVLVMGSVVVTCGHLEALYLPGFIAGFLREGVSVTRVLQRPLRMPNCGCEIPFFVMFRGSTVGPGRKFVLLGSLPVRLVHGLPSFRRRHPSSLVHGADQSLSSQECHAWTALDHACPL